MKKPRKIRVKNAMASALGKKSVRKRHAGKTPKEISDHYKRLRKIRTSNTQKKTRKRKLIRVLDDFFALPL